MTRQLSDTRVFWELKDKAKWSHNSEEKKTAITELSSLGEGAIPSLEEIMNVTAFQEIKAACIEAIKAAKGNSKVATAEPDEGKVLAKTTSFADLPP